MRKAFADQGAVDFLFSEATSPAIKQMRQKLLMANIGACNLWIDEIGSNLSGSVETLTTYLELFDVGMTKERLTKSTKENIRVEKIEGSTPANLLMFGTSSKLLDGGKTEELFNDLLELGYARRCFFGFAKDAIRTTELTPQEIHDQLFNQEHDDFIAKLNDRFGLLADVVNINKEILIEEDVALKLIEYRLDCEQRSLIYNPETESKLKSELDHRYFKVLKLAGAYAFVDCSPKITLDHIEYAIRLAEECGEAFKELLTPEKPYVKLAKYLAKVRTEVTVADLDIDLPYYRGSKAQKDEMLLMAQAWGYRHQIVIKKMYSDGIMFLSADTIEETNLDEMRFSYTNNSDMTTGYQNVKVPFHKMHKLMSLPDYHWLSHHLKGGDKQDENGHYTGYRKEDNVIAGLNMLVLDVDGGCTLDTAKMIFEDYQAMFYTTKRHTADVNRFRIVLPVSHILKLDSKDFKEMYDSVRADLPFETDDQCSTRSKKWLTNPQTQIEYSKGTKLFDIVSYIPKSSRNEQREKLKDQSDLDNLERWVINNTGIGNRNSMLLRYAMILVDAGHTFSQIKEQVSELNTKIQDSLDEIELTNTVLQTVASRLSVKNP